MRVLPLTITRFSLQQSRHAGMHGACVRIRRIMYIVNINTKR